MDHSFSQSWRVESQDNSLFGTIRDSSPFIVDYSLGLHMGMSKKRGHASSYQEADPLTLLTYTAHSLKAALRFCPFESHGLNM